MCESWWLRASATATQDWPNDHAAEKSQVQSLGCGVTQPDGAAGQPDWVTGDKPMLVVGRKVNWHDVLTEQAW